MISVGIDVGGSKKGFHGVALEGRKLIGKIHSSDVQQIVSWCTQTVFAEIVAVDAPCRWAQEGKSRPAERQLMGQRILCYSTPIRDVAVSHKTNFYGWVLRGEELFAALEPYFPLYTGKGSLESKCCFETFPHAITWHLRGGKASGKLKRIQRTELLRAAGIDTRSFQNIDFIDAALCALAAQSYSKSDFCKYGEEETGYIIVPKMRAQLPV